MVLFIRSLFLTLKQNGVVERKHRYLFLTARAIMFHGCLPNDFWGDCIADGAYIINRMSLTTLGYKYLYDLVYSKTPSLTHLRVIGCLAFTTSLKKGDKFAAKARKLYNLGMFLVRRVINC